MANNYTLSALEFEIRSQQERDFIKNLENRAEAIVDGDHFSNMPPFEESVHENGWGWDLELTRESAHFSSSEGANNEALVLGLQEFLGYFRSAKEVISFTWAYTCSSMRAGEFGGGGVAFNCKNAKWLDTQTELGNLIKDVQRDT